MEKRSRSIRIVLAAVMACLMLAVCAVASADADPIRVSSLSEPQSVISEQDVSITIKVYNSSQTDMQEEITLFNPDGISVEKYSGLKGEQSVTYTGKWHVTKDQIDEGKIKYYIQYTVDTGNGPTKTTRTVPVTIQTEEAAPQLTATYSVSPVSAREGQEVTLSYTLSNTGNVELRNIVVENEGVSKEKVTAPSLSVGEKVTLTDKFTMGKKEVVSKPSVSYQAAESKKTLTISDMAKKTITVAEDGLEISLKPKSEEKVYPGESTVLVVEMKNTGNSAYSGLEIKLSDGTVVESGVEIKPGASYKKEVSFVTTQDTSVTASASGTDANGEAVGVVSGEVAIKTQDASRALVLSVKADAATDVIYSEPAVIRFGVVVENIGQTDATTLTIEEAGTTVAKIASLPAGESRTAVFDVETSIAGKFQFVVKGKDADGNERAYESNVIQVNYLAPTPTPTAVPTPTPVPPTPTPVPTATPAPTLGEIIAEHVNPVVLYSVAGVLAALLVIILTVSGVSGAKRKKRLAQALDTIERSPDTRNHRGVQPRRRRAQGAQQAQSGKKDKKIKKAEKAEENEVIVPTPELTDEEPEDVKEEIDPNSTTPARDAMRRLEREEGRRRRMNVEVPGDETLRVMPVDQRPEFIAQGPVDDSQTRIFTPVYQQEEPEAPAAPMIKEEPAVKPAVKEAPAAPAAKRAKAAPVAPVAPVAPAAPMTGDDPEAGQTIRLNRQELDALREQQESLEREDKFAGKGQKRKDIKPMKKKGLFAGFGKKGKKKADDDEDDFVEAYDEDDFDDDDLY